MKILLAGAVLVLSAVLSGCAVVPAYPSDVHVSGGVYVNPPPAIIVAPAYEHRPHHRHHRHHRHHH